MSTARIKIKRLIIIIAVFIICVLPVFISNTYSTPNTSVFVDDSNLVQTGTVTASDGDTAPGSPSYGTQNTTLYPCDISETENNGLRQIIKTYELDAGESPDYIPRESFENGGWLYAFTDLTKKETPVYVTKDDSTTVSIKSETKDIDEIIGQLTPTLEYSSPDGFTGLLTLNIPSITIEAADEADTASEADAETPDELNADSTDVSSSYHTTAVYKGTLSKLINDKTNYSAYFTGMMLTPSPTPAAPLQPDDPAQQKSPSLARAVVISSCFALVCCLVFFILFRGNVKVYNLSESAYVLLGEARIGFTYPVINLTPFAGKAVTGSFILILNRNIAKRLYDKPVTTNYGGKSLQHIVQYNGGEYHMEVSF